MQVQRVTPLKPGQSLKKIILTSPASISDKHRLVLAFWYSSVTVKKKKSTTSSDSNITHGYFSAMKIIKY